ncbi:MAG TPA: hypothetical protein VI544_01035 [Candidatus Nanoarchaeia archaeon]|nr:hypothetical protein [Candidatus Nanoarchaeia archaeon]
MKFEKGLILLGLLLIISLMGSVSALNLEVEEIEKTPVVISELEDPAVFDFVIDNKGSGQDIEIYSLVGALFEPKGTFYLPSGESTIEVKVYPGQSARAKDGNYAFEYQIKGEGADIFKDQLTIKIVKLKDVLKIEPQSIYYGDLKAAIKVRNVQNIAISDANLDINSVFFDGSEKISLGPFESTEISLPIKTANIRDLAAGPYVVEYDLEIGGENAKIENTVSYQERKNIATEKTKSGWIIRAVTITKTNEGNLAVSDRIEVKKNILTRLFTSFSNSPLSSERRGLFVYYMWERDLNPAESWSVEVRTNYTLPFALILLILFSAGAVYVYSRTALVVGKRCSFVRTKGGEFALKITLQVKARKPIDNIELFDRIPMATKLYTKTGMPHKFDERLGRLSWKIDRLNSGEERIFSYIIYSTIRIVGRLELSPATAHFVQDGKPTYVHSNRTYFVSDIHPRY